MRLVDVLPEECVAAGERLADKNEALRRVARLAKQSPLLKDFSEHQLLEGLQEREALGSTGFGNGLAIPHCQLKGAPGFVVGIITVDGGVDFEALDGEKVNLIIFIVAPQGEANAHIRLLSAVSQTLLVPGAVKEILAEPTAKGVRESFLRYTRADIDTKDQVEKRIFHVFVQNENVFREILQILTGADSSSLVVMDAANTGAYLAKIPLFAGLWRDDAKMFSKIIVAVVDKPLSNEMLRRIETITGNLNDCSGVMVTIQDLAYAAGTLAMES